MGFGDALGSQLGGAVRGVAQGANQVAPQLGGMNNLFGMFNTAVLGPANAQADQSLAGLGLQEGMLNANYGLQQGALNQQLQSGLGRIGIDQGALARRRGLLPQEEALQQQLFGLSQQDLNTSRQGIGLEREQANFQNQQQTRSAWSGATARGATNTSGFSQQLSDIGTMLQERLAGIGLEEQRLNTQQGRFDIQKKQHALSYNEQLAQLDDQAKRLGLEKSDLQSRISQALSQLGLSQAVSTVDIINAMNDVQNGRINALGGVLGQISQIDPRLMMGTQQPQQQPSLAGMHIPGF